jgi:hypothetical protein
MAGHGLLSEMQGVSGPRDVQFPGHGQKRPQLPQIKITHPGSIRWPLEFPR